MRGEFALIETILKLENVQISEHVNNWEEAVYLAVTPLVKGGYVEQRYIDGIIDNTYKFGPYYVLAPELALLHARPEQGVIEKQLALTVLRTPVKFSENGYDVRILITLAASDNVSHLEALKDLSQIISDENSIDKIIHAKTTEEILNLFLPKGR